MIHEKFKLLIRIQKSMVFTPIEYLPDGSFIAKIYPSDWYRKNDRRGVLRANHRVHDRWQSQRTGHNEVHRLATNLFDADLYPAFELVLLYHERWEQELFNDEQKTHQDPVVLRRQPTFAAKRVTA